MISPKLDQLEREIASVLVEKLEHQEISLNRAAEISAYVMNFLPDNLTDEQVDAIIPQLDSKFADLAGILHTHMKEYDEVTKHGDTNAALQMINQGNINQTLNLINEHLTKKL